MTASKSDSSNNAGYEAVIYVHGIGSQRRFEESGRLIDSLDRYVYSLNPDPENRTVFFRKIRSKIEISRLNADSYVEYIRTFFRDRDAPDQEKWVRFYEIYWAPVLAGQKSVKRILIWFISQTFRPLITTVSPWRERQRLRRASLMALMEKKRFDPDALEGVELRDFRTLAERYYYFESPEALRRYPTGTFREFKEYLTTRSSKKPDTLKRHIKLAGLWKKEYRNSEIRNFTILVSVMLALVLLAGGAVALIVALAERYTGLLDGTMLEGIAASAPSTFVAAIGVLVSIGSVLGIGKKITDYIGDIEAWSAYRETDEKHERRTAILDEALNNLRHVLADDDCNRVTIVSHSLGTTIAHDMLLIAARENRATNPNDPISGPIKLDKIEHFITLGSPIDKIEYFFESYVSNSHRYKRIVEGRRGDIGNEPFSQNGQPYIHWINIWDDGDPVSGPLQSPANHKNVKQRVDNIHTQSLSFPNPGKSHTAYFENLDVVTHLYEIIFKREHSFQTLHPRGKLGKDWESVYIGPEIDPPKRRWPWMLSAITLPWISASALGVYMFYFDDWRLFIPSGILLVALVFGYVKSTIQKTNNSI